MRSGTRRKAAVMAAAMGAALGAAAPAQAVTCCYEVRLQRTSPALWVGVTTTLRAGGVYLRDTRGPQGTERWALAPEDTARGRAYRFISAYSNKCMDIQGPSRVNGAEVHQWDCHGGDSQKWWLLRGPVGRQFGHQLVNVYANKCLDVTGFRNRDLTALQVWDCSHAWNQDFVLTRVAP